METAQLDDLLSQYVDIMNAHGRDSAAAQEFRAAHATDGELLRLIEETHRLDDETKAGRTTLAPTTSTGTVTAKPSRRPYLAYIGVAVIYAVFVILNSSLLWTVIGSTAVSIVTFSLSRRLRERKMSFFNIFALTAVAFMSVFLVAAAVIGVWPSPLLIVATALLAGGLTFVAWVGSLLP